MITSEHIVNLLLKNLGTGLKKKHPMIFLMGLKVVRFDYEQNIVYLSIGFSEISDSIMLKITDSNDNVISSSYNSISKYYDNRDAVVTSTADDWGAYSDFSLWKPVKFFEALIYGFLVE